MEQMQVPNQPDEWAPAAHGQRMRRAERREQILSAATRAFARAGFAATGLDELAAEAQVTRVILYRHFESKADLYRAVLRRACDRLAAATGPPGFHAGSVEALLASAADEPASFRLLFRHAVREPEFRQEMDELRAQSVAIAHRHMAGLIPDPAWALWAAALVPTVAVEAVMAWLDVGQPDQATAAARVAAAVSGVIEAARSASGKEPTPPTG
jgi:AcrR family transcriptional regulator